MWAGSRAVADALKNKLPSGTGSVTVPTTGPRSGRHTQLAGLGQILNLSQAFTLELAIKALYRTLNPGSNPENTHDLSRLFDYLNKDIKARLRSKWVKSPGRSDVGQTLTLDEFLSRYSLLFESSRYLYESNESYSTNSKDFDIAIWLIVTERINKQQDKTLLQNLYNVMVQEQQDRGSI